MSGSTHVFNIWAHLSPSSGRISLGSECVSSVTPFSLTNMLSSSGTTQQLLRLTWTWSMSCVYLYNALFNSQCQTVIKRHVSVRQTYIS